MGTQYLIMIPFISQSLKAKQMGCRAIYISAFQISKIGASGLEPPTPSSPIGRQPNVPRDDFNVRTNLKAYETHHQ